MIAALMFLAERFGQSIGSDLDWGYVTVPQTALNGGVVAMSRHVRILCGRAQTNEDSLPQRENDGWFKWLELRSLYQSV